MRNEITQDELRALVDYDSATGEFSWREREVQRGGWNGALSGRRAGHTNKGGYLVVRVKGRPYKGHRLAWLYVYGTWPKNLIDHIDGNPSNNRIDNLRDVTNTVNMQNQRAANGVTRSGLLGVRWRANRSRWIAEIYIHGKPKRIGSFTDKHEAHAAYVAAKRKYHEGCSI